MKESSWSPEDIFVHLEKDFEKAQSRRRSTLIATSMLAFVGVALILVGISNGLPISLLGYGTLFVCVYRLASEIRDKVNLKVAELNREIIERQRRRQEFVERNQRYFKRDR